jgi:hypothetical protein
VLDPVGDSVDAIRVAAEGCPTRAITVTVTGTDATDAQAADPDPQPEPVRKGH